MAAWDNVEGFEFQHDLITPSLDRQAACLSLMNGNGMPTLRLLARWAGFPTKFGEMKGLGKMLKKIFLAVCRLRLDG